MRTPARQGFSLLEVMVAIAILGLALSVILSAQGGLSTSNRRAANMANAVEFGRCKMTEIEENLLKLGYPELDDLQTGIPCCSDSRGSDATEGHFTCDTRVEKVVLPNPPSSDGDGGLSLGNSLAAGDGGAMSPLGSISALGAGGAGAAGLSLDGGMTGLGNALNSMGGAEGVIGMVMGIIYPSLKPMLEASIRRLTVTVKWREGILDKELSMTQYVTNPQRSGFVAGANPNAMGSAVPGGTAAPVTSGAAGGLGGAGGAGHTGGPFR